MFEIDVDPGDPVRLDDLQNVSDRQIACSVVAWVDALAAAAVA